MSVNVILKTWATATALSWWCATAMADTAVTASSTASPPAGFGIPGRQTSSVQAPPTVDPIRNAIISAANPPPPKRRIERPSLENKGRPFHRLRWRNFEWPSIPSREWEATR